MGDVPQKINYHVKELERVGLVRRVGTRRRRNLLEVLYQAVARTFVISETVNWDPAVTRRSRDQGALGHLVTVAERPAYVPSLTLTATLDLPDDAARRAFAEDYLRMLAELTSRHGGRLVEPPGPPARPDPSPPEAPFRLVVTCYPDPAGEAGPPGAEEGEAT